MSYPQPSIQAFIVEHFIPVRLLLGRSEDQKHFKAYRVVWTPTIAILDRRAAMHYQSPGYLPPQLLLAMLHIGLGRALTAWSRYPEAAALLEHVADQGGSLAPEALYWLGVARYLPARRRSILMQPWNRLRQAYPESEWAARVPPNQEDEPEA